MTVRDLIGSLHPDVIALQEHWLIPANLGRLDQLADEYFVYATPATSECIAQGPLRVDLAVALRTLAVTSPHVSAG